MAKSNWHTRIYAVLRHPRENKVLLLPAGGGWQLPDAGYDGNLWVAQADIAVPALSAALGAQIWLLRQLQYQVLEESCRTTAVYECELLDMGWAPPAGARWVDLAAFKRMDFSPGDLGETVRTYLEGRARASIPPERPPWSMPGWRSEVRHWAAGQLRAHGAVLQRMEQVKHWGISSVIRLKTDREDFYFKAPQTSQPLFANEARVTAHLAALFPGRVPEPLAVDVARDWMLLRDFGTTASWRGPPEKRVALYRQFARLQIESIAHVDGLLQAGCLDRRLDVLAGQIDPLLGSERATARVDPARLAALRALAPELKALCNRLASYGLPATLVHGDLHTGNTFIGDSDFVVYDWTDACIAHPFFDLSFVAQEQDREIADLLVRAYLEPWQDFEPLPRLQEMWAIARVLTLLHHAFSYASIVQNLEPDSKKELDFTHYYLEGLLKAAEAYRERIGEG